MNIDKVPHSSQDDAPMYLLLGISAYVQGKAFIANFCVSPHLPKLGIQVTPRFGIDSETAHLVLTQRF